MEKIIIIEDDEIIREELKNFLSKYGYEIVAPTSFDNVVKFILNENANLVLLDINLPIFDGYYICREVRKKSDIPIIIVTSRDSDMDELMSMNLGSDDFVTKPYNTQILLARIAALLKRSGLNITTNNIIHRYY
ncbi:response regulator [Romboutsia ilealis]|uniref:response regulator n=1 Tax=Romboutsia ilealis TaxID=1115758 RepID=UPI002ED43F61